MLLLTKLKGPRSNFHYSGFPNHPQTKSSLNITICQSQIKKKQSITGDPVPSIGKFGQFLTPPHLRNADVLNGWSLSPFNPLLYVQYTMWSINNVAAEDPLETHQDGLVFPVLCLFVEGLEIPLIWYVLPLSHHGRFPVGLWQLHYQRSTRYIWFQLSTASRSEILLNSWMKNNFIQSSYLVTDLIRQYIQIFYFV